MHHALTVGEIFDKAIDLCLRNAGRIAPVFGAYLVVKNSLVALNTTYMGGGIFAAMHLQPRAAILPGVWITIFTIGAHFIFLPLIGAALMVLFDHSLKGLSVGFYGCFRSSTRRVANILLISLVCNFIGLVSFALVSAGLFAAFYGAKTPVIISIVLITASCVALCVSGLLVLGATIGFARVALDSGLVFQSVANGVATVFAKVNRYRALGLGVSLLVLFLVGLFGGIYAGVEAFALTGWDAANAIVHTIGDMIAWTVLAAVATVYYRTLVPAM